MGNCLSQILAEITTSYLIKKATEMCKNDEIIFVYKYVDDIISGIDMDYIDTFQAAISSQKYGLTLKLTRENSRNEVNYLNLTVGRYPDENNTIHVRWWQKECSCKHILDFHSFHPEKIKKNVTQEFTNVALKLSSEQHWKDVISLVRINLRNSN